MSSSAPKIPPVYISVRLEIYQDGSDKKRRMVEQRALDVFTHKTAGRRGVALRILRAASRTGLAGAELANEHVAELLLRQTRAALEKDPIALYAIQKTEAVEARDDREDATPKLDVGQGEAGPEQVDIDPRMPRSNEVLLSEIGDSSIHLEPDVLERAKLDEQLRLAFEGEVHMRPIKVRDYRTWRLVVHKDRVDRTGGLRPRSIVAKYTVRVEFVYEGSVRIWDVSFNKSEEAQTCRAIFEKDPQVIKMFVGHVLLKIGPDAKPGALKEQAALLRSKPDDELSRACFKELLNLAGFLLLGHWKEFKSIKAHEFCAQPSSQTKEVWTFNTPRIYKADQ